MSRYSLTPAAEQDIDESVSFVASDRPAAAVRWLERIEAVCEELAEYPAMGVSRLALGAGVRAFPVENYVIYYRKRRKEVQVLRVLHAARDVPNVFDDTAGGANPVRRFK